MDRRVKQRLSCVSVVTEPAEAMLFEYPYSGGLYKRKPAKAMLFKYPQIVRVTLENKYITKDGLLWPTQHKI